MVTKRRRLTHDVGQRIMSLYASGEKVEVISALFQISISTVDRFVERNGGPLRKIGRPLDEKKALIKERILKFMRGRVSVSREDIWPLMTEIMGYREKWDIISAMKRDGTIVSAGRARYRLVEEKEVRDLKQDIFEEVLSALVLSPLSGPVGDVAQTITDRVWGVFRSTSEMGVAGSGGSAGSQSVQTAKTSTDISSDKDDKRKESEKKVADAVARIQKIRDKGEPDPTSGGFFI